MTEGIAPVIAAAPTRVSRRWVLTLAALAPLAATGLPACTPAGPGAEWPDPRPALADAARTDAALAAAAVAADPVLAERLEPVRAARAEHAVALDAAVTGASATAAPPPGAPATNGAPDLDGVRVALRASADAAAGAVVELPTDRVGLVASIAACCAAYAELLA